MKHGPSLTVRLALLFAAVSTTVLLAIGAVIGYLVEEHFEMLDVAELTGKMSLIEHILTRPGASAPNAELSRQLDDALVGHHGLSVAVYAGSDRAVYATVDADFPRAVLNGGLSGLLTKPMQPVTWQNQGRSFRGIAAPQP